MGYSERDVSSDPQAVQEMLGLLGGRMMTPTIVVGQEVLVGFAASRPRLETLFPKRKQEA